MTPKKDPTEDSVDSIVKYFLEKKGWKTAYYSPPCGSWSIIRFKFSNKDYRSFSPRDASRPDLLLYRIINNNLFLLIIESKETPYIFTEQKLKDYIKSMRQYITDIIEMKYIHQKSSGAWINWNNKIPEFKSFNIHANIVFIAGSKKSDWSRNLLVFKNLIKRVKIDDTIFGILTCTDWTNLIDEIEIFENTSQLLISELPNCKIKIKF